MTHILKATSEDLKDLVTMGRAFFYEAEWDKLYEWDNLAAASALEDLINNESAIVYMAKENDMSIGMAAAVLYPIWYNPDILVAQEFFMYVQPDKRKGCGHKLKAKLEEEAIRMGARTMAMGSVEALPSLDTYYARSGYSPSEKTFIKRL